MSTTSGSITASGYEWRGRPQVSRLKVYVVLIAAVSGVMGVAAHAGAQVVCDPYSTGCVQGEQRTPQLQPSPPAAAAPQLLNTQVAPQVAPAAQGQTLPLTGADIVGLVVLAGFLVGVGLVLTLAGRRHRDRAAPA